AVERVAKAFQIGDLGQSATLAFKVTPPPHPGSTEMIARAEVNGATFDTSRIEIHYDHIPPLLLQPTARLKTVALDLAIRGHQVGYIAGAGDSVAQCLEQMGYAVKSLKAEDLTDEGLHGLDAVVIGVR